MVLSLGFRSVAEIVSFLHEHSFNENGEEYEDVQCYFFLPLQCSLLGVASCI